MPAKLSELNIRSDENWNGDTSFGWKGHDGTVYSNDSAAVNIEITPENDPPVVTPISKTGTEDTNISFSVSDFSGNYSDPENDALTKIQITSLPANGKLFLDGVEVTENQEIDASELANLVFDPDENWNGDTSFGWKGHDGTVYSNDSAAVNIEITPENDPPVVTPISKTGTEDTNISFSVSDFSGNYSDPESDPLTKIQITSLPANGTLLLNGTPVTENQEIDASELANLVFDPDENWNGDTSFGWKGHDGTVYSNDSAAVNIEITAVNDPPVVTPISKTGTEDTNISFSVSDFSGNYSDPESDPLTKIQITSLPANGKLLLGTTPVNVNDEIDATQLANLVFDPDKNWNGDTSFGWKGHDGTVYSNDSAAVNIEITAVNDPPTVTPISKTETEDTNISFSVSDFTGNYSDPENNPLTKIQITSLPANGKLLLNGTPVTENQEIDASELANLVFDPDENWNGDTSFGWKGHDGTVYSNDSAAVNIEITPDNDPPVVTPISKTGTEDTNISFSVSDFSGNYSDPESDPLTKIQITSLPKQMVICC